MHGGAYEVVAQVSAMITNCASDTQLQAPCAYIIAFTGASGTLTNNAKPKFTVK